jgi:DNA-binding response OmpR family regulator
MSRSHPNSPRPSISRTPAPHPSSHALASSPPARRPGVLLVTPSRTQRDMLAAQLTTRGFSVHHAAGAEEALQLLSPGGPARGVQSVLVAWALSDGDAVELVETMVRRRPHLAPIVLADDLDHEQALHAMRCGAADVLPARPDADTLTRRIAQAVARRRPAAELDRRARRALRLCRTLEGARAELAQRVGELCEEMAALTRDMSRASARTAATSELNALIRQDLDVEALMRTALEFLLARLGPLNAAVFLPAPSGDLSLGAYVNYDGPRDGAEGLLEGLADAASRAEHAIGPVVMHGQEEIEDRLGIDLPWTAQSSMVALPCRERDECLAVVLLFRDRAVGFSEEHLWLLRRAGELLGAQLARVVRTHKRHKGGVADAGQGQDDDLDLAA